MRSYRSTTAAAEKGRKAFSWRMNSGMRKSHATQTDHRIARCAQVSRLRTALVRERDGDQEQDHNESDRISIKLFPIDVDTHRTALLFAEATMKQ